MSLFICQNCQCIENTALGRYWSRRDAGLWQLADIGRALCSACAPIHFANGDPTGYGQWHGKFKRRRAELRDKATVRNPEVYTPATWIPYNPHPAGGLVCACGATEYDPHCYCDA